MAQSFDLAGEGVGGGGWGGVGRRGVAVHLNPEVWKYFLVMQFGNSKTYDIINDIINLC